MRKWNLFAILFFLFMFLFSGTGNAAGTELMTAFSVRITVVENGIEYEWEYDSPSHYEFEQGERVIKGAAAKEKVEQMVNDLKLDEEEEVEAFVSRLQKSSYPNIERLDIRYMNGEGKLYTWVWEGK
ncbi:hypothetical protein ACFFHM_22840 [Halalkalibacter kiskunsagensis]|uniref:Uncharacterized protein n=1 Tax=Halalkalibacter kiskunsagensis TaxID=1548599 RepID=A0ABV6KIV0_9BACI